MLPVGGNETRGISLVSIVSDGEESSSDDESDIDDLHQEQGTKNNSTASDDSDSDTDFTREKESGFHNSRSTLKSDKKALKNRNPSSCKNARNSDEGSRSVLLNLPSKRVVSRRKPKSKRISTESESEEDDCDELSTEEESDTLSSLDSDGKNLEADHLKQLDLCQPSSKAIRKSKTTASSSEQRRLPEKKAAVEICIVSQKNSADLKFGKSRNVLDNSESSLSSLSGAKNPDDSESSSPESSNGLINFRSANCKPASEAREPRKLKSRYKNGHAKLDADILNEPDDDSDSENNKGNLMSISPSRARKSVKKEATVLHKAKKDGFSESAMGKTERKASESGRRSPRAAYLSREIPSIAITGPLKRSRVASSDEDEEDAIPSSGTSDVTDSGDTLASGRKAKIASANFSIKLNSSEVTAAAQARKKLRR